MKRLLSISFIVGIALYLTGCSKPVIRNSVERVPRVDQKVDGNRGYLDGQAPAGTAEKQFTDRQVYRTEIELPDLVTKTEKTAADSTAMKAAATSDSGTVSTASAEETPESVSAPLGTEQKSYTVQKNDTLQKISQKFYGTTTKWKSIFEANTATLKDPDQLLPGQTLVIPGVAEYKK